MSILTLARVTTPHRRNTRQQIHIIVLKTLVQGAFSNKASAPIGCGQTKMGHLPHFELLFIICRCGVL